MNCPKCNEALADDALYCSACGEKFAVEEQKQRVNAVFANTKNLILKQVKSPIFLVVAILFSVIFAAQAVTMITGGFGGIISGIIPFIFMLIAVIGLWTSYAAKDTATLTKSLRQASIFDAYTRVMYSIARVLLCIVAVISFIVTLFAGLFGGNIGSGLVSAIVLLVVFAIIIVIVSLFKGIFARRRRYFSELAEAAQTCNYTPAKAPVVGSYIIGGSEVLSAIFSFGMAFSVISVVHALFGEILIELEMLEMVDALLVTLTGTLTMLGISSLISGGYMVLSAIWMSSMHKAELENRALLMAECARLDEIENATREAMFADERKENGEQEPALLEEQGEPIFVEDIPVVEEVTVEEAVEEIAEKSAEELD